MNEQKTQFGEKALFKRPNQIATVFQCVQDRADKQALNVDFAPNPNNKPNWSNKFSIQLTIDELALLVALFTKKVSNCNFSFHGDNNNKSLIVHRNEQDNQTVFYFELWLSGHKECFIFLTQMEAFRVFKLALKQLGLFYNQSEKEVIESIHYFYK